MKKLNLLIAIILLATMLLAANPAGKLVRLEVINRTDYPVYIKLEGKNTDAFYYLTISEDEDDDTKIFTVLSDDYKRTTWACDGIKSSGDLAMTGNVRLVFTPCGRVPLRWVQRWYRWGQGEIEMFALYRMPNYGEPTMEKVWYWKEYSFVRWTKIIDPIIALLAPFPGFEWSPDGIHWISLNPPGPLNGLDGHFTLWIPLKLGVANRTYKGPVGVWWRYQY